MQEVLRQTTTQKFNFFVSGAPASQGSKTAFARIIKDASGKQRAIANVVEQDKSLHQWRHAIGQVARLMKPSGWKTDGLFTVSVVFYLPRPKVHYRTTGALKPGAPVFHEGRKDCDKMYRAVGDALTEICYDDDSMIVSISGVKLYCTSTHDPGAWISVGRLDEHSAAAAVNALMD